MRVARLGRRRVELHQLDFALAVWGPQHRELRPDAVERHDAVHPAALDLALASRLESELDEEFDCGCEVVDRDADVFQPPDCHVFRWSHAGRVAAIRANWTRSGRSATMTLDLPNAPSEIVSRTSPAQGHDHGGRSSSRSRIAGKRGP